MEVKITQYDFPDPRDVFNCVEGDLFANCRTIAGKVAENVQRILA